MSERPPPEDTATTYDRSDLAEDLRALVRAIEDVHPDPYLGYDGRVALHARVERLVRDLPESATVEECYRLAAPVVAGMDDSHSLLRAPGSTGEGDDPSLPLSMRVVGDRLYVDSVADEGLTDLLGGRLLGVEGVPVADLAERYARFRAAENRSARLSNAASAIEEYGSLARLLDRSAPPPKPSLTVAVDGDERSLAVDPVTGDPDPVAELSTTMAVPTGSGPRYRLYEGGDAAVFVPGDLQGYRESLEAALATDAGMAADLAPAAYRRHVGGDPPNDLDATVGALPSMVETLERLTDRMAAVGTETLVVDLRDNPGGDSQFVFHLAYALRGWDGVRESLADVRSLRRRTEAHRQRYGTRGGEAGLGTADDNPADYDVSDFLGRDAEDALDRTRSLLTESETFASFADRTDDDGRYDPNRLIVAVSAGTMSSAFAGAAQLSTLGADVVGVPPGQAPRSFGEPVERTLPNTGLTARIAGSMYHWTDDPDADALALDAELTPSRFEAVDAAADAGLRLAFEHAGHVDPETIPTPVE